MSSSATIIELDRFRRVRDLLNAVRHHRRREMEPPKAVDWYLPGFVGKERISTVFGELPIEALRRWDDVRTYSGATAKVQKVDRIHLDQDFIRMNAGALPIRIPANAFGPGKPKQDLLVSPGQEVCPDGHVASHFSMARDLRGRFTLDLTHSTGLTYYRFHCGEPTIVRVEGIWVRVQP